MQRSCLRKLTCRSIVQSKHVVREKKITMKFCLCQRKGFAFTGLNVVKLKETSQSTESREVGLFCVTYLSIKH